MRFRIVSCLALSLLVGLLAATDDSHASGTRPRNVAVSPDGNTVLATSYDSNGMSVLINQSLSYQLLDGHSWGVCFLDDLRAVVTAPSLDGIYLLTRPTASSSFSATLLSSAGTSLRGCTEVIRGTGEDTVLVACRGKAPDGAEPWQHAVYEIDVTTGSVIKTFITEREPRSMVLSPSGARLYVGTAQGALGGDGIAMNSPWADTSFDGGSIVSYDVASASVVRRFAIGSPVRGLAVWQEIAPPGSLSTTYRVFFTYVGEGGQSEAPPFGGRVIPNVISSIKFDILQNHKPVGRQDVVIRHSPDLDRKSVV